MISVQVSRVTDFVALGVRWRDLEQRSDGSFFQSWSWVGCLACERFSDAVLVEATEAGRSVALGLFNRVRRRFGPSRLYLAEAGSEELDCPYVEQNGILSETGREAELTELCLRRLVAAHDVVMSGVGEPVVAAVRRAGGLVVTRCGKASPFVDLAALRQDGGDYLAGRSANTRQQLRRSERHYERDGPIRLERAGSAASALDMFDAMAVLHQQAWQARGQPGSFARPFFRRFHCALITSGFPRGEVELLQISAGERIIGFLYNFVWRERVSAYQSGFAYPEEARQAKPGLTCHLAAIREALDRGLDIYDFLAGEDRYKRSMADRSHGQFWLEAGPVWSLRLLAKTLLGRTVAARTLVAKTLQYRTMVGRSLLVRIRGAVPNVAGMNDDGETGVGQARPIRRKAIR